MPITSSTDRPGKTGDRVVRLGGSLIQHGRLNDRVYLMHLDPADLPELLPRLDAMATGKGYSKIFAKIPVTVLPGFLSAGYREEARVPGFFRGRVTSLFLGKYLDPRRARPRRVARRESILAEALKHAADRPASPVRLPEEYQWDSAGPADARELARLYRAVFETYPFPIHNPVYIRRSMESKVRYGCIRNRARIVAVSSAEINREDRVVEMTDFATLPEARGRSFARFLLARMEQEMADAGMLTAYTIARALSISMSKTFAGMKYRYAGTLINNTQISGGLESMNVWHKPLRRPAR